MQRFFITIGRDREAPRIAQEVMAPDARTAHNQAFDLRESVEERVEVVAVPSEEEFAAADVARSLGKAQRLHQCADHRALEDQVQWMRCVGAI